MLHDITPSIDRTNYPVPELPKRVAWDPDSIDVNTVLWMSPPLVRILIYMDGAPFNGGSFRGLRHAINAVDSDPWPWARFDVTTAHRYADESADIDSVTLLDLDLDAFDELWLFGVGTNAGLLSGGEVNALESFMDRGGGVMTTGDHDNLGAGLSGSAKRIKDLRMYPAPATSRAGWSTTILDGSGDGAFEFDELADCAPQVIRPAYLTQWSLGTGFPLLKRSPHALLSAEHGVLKKLPGRRPGGQVVIPVSFPTSDWPTVGSHQPQPEVVAWGRITDPDARKSAREIPVIGAYNGHGANVGRIVADSSWQHWFDVNLDGYDTAGDDYRDIISYYRNVAAWLAPPDKQAGMRDGVFWRALHEKSIVEHDLRLLPLPRLVPLVRDALGRWASQCLVSAWVFELIPVTLSRQLVAECGAPKIPLALEDAIIAEAMIELQLAVDSRSGQVQPTCDLDIIVDAIVMAAPRAADRFERACTEHLRAASSTAPSLRPHLSDIAV